MPASNVFVSGRFEEERDPHQGQDDPEVGTYRISVSQNAYRSLRGLKRRSVDIVVGSVSGFAERKKRKTLENIIDREGVLLYEK